MMSRRLLATSGGFNAKQEFPKASQDVVQFGYTFLLRRGHPETLIPLFSGCQSFFVYKNRSRHTSFQFLHQPLDPCKSRLPECR